MSVELFEVCKAGDLASVKDLLPHVRQALNEFLGTKKENLLMWYVLLLVVVVVGGGDGLHVVVVVCLVVCLHVVIVVGCFCCWC